MSDLKVAAVVGFKDDLSKPAQRALTAMTDAAVKASTGIAKSNDKVIDSYRKVNESAAKVAASSHRMYQDRERLGTRSEQRIQREVNITEAAYRRLIQSGNLSWREQVRAAEAMRTKVRELNNEMGKYTAAQRAAQGGRMAAGVVAGGVAATMVLKPKFDAALAWDDRLRDMANTAYAGQPIEAKRAGMAELTQAINTAVRAGGGSLDQAALTLDAMIASGAVTTKQAETMLPTVMKGATASGAEAEALATIGVRGMQSFKIAAERFPQLIDMAIAGGQSGGFELKDMARHLPAQMAAATASGLGGIEGFGRLVALNQAAVTTAGTKDEAGVNLQNLLNKINSRDTAMDAKKLGIDLSGYLRRERGKGIDSVDAFVNLADRLTAKDPAYQQLQKQLAGAKDDATKKAALESMVAIVQGSAIGQIVQDQQAMKALVGIMNNRELLARSQRAIDASGGATQGNFDFKAEGARFKTQQLGNEKDIAKQRALDTLTPAIGTLADKTTALAREYPGMTTAITGATIALTALTAAAGAAAGVNILTGGKALPGVVSGGKRMLDTGGKLLRNTGGLLTTGVAGTTAGTAALWAGAGVAAGAGGYALGKLIVNPLIDGVLSFAAGKKTNLGGAIFDLTHQQPKIYGDTPKGRARDEVGKPLPLAAAKVQGPAVPQLPRERSAAQPAAVASPVAVKVQGPAMGQLPRERVVAPATTSAALAKASDTVRGSGRLSERSPDQVGGKKITPTTILSRVIIKEPPPISGDIRITIDQRGQASVASVKTDQPNLRFKVGNVHNGPYMGVSG